MIDDAQDFEADMDTEVDLDDRDVVSRYFAAFNDGDVETMLACVSDDVVHNVNEGRARVGRDRFEAFLHHAARCYEERLEDITVMTGPPGRFAVEYVVHGTYRETDEGQPPARGQTYVLPAGSFLTAREGEIGRVTTYYNLAEWRRQVS